MKVISNSTSHGVTVGGLNARIAGAQSREIVLLSVILFLLYMIYASIGRDVFYNPSEIGYTGDPIGAILPYARIAVSIFAVGTVSANVGLSWALSKVPFLFAPFVALALASCFWSDEWKSTFQTAGTLAAMWVAVPILIHRMGLVQAVIVSLHLMAAIVIFSAALAVLIPSIGTHTSAGYHLGRWRGIFSHKNGLGPWAAYASVFIFTHGHLCRAPRAYWWFAWICAVSCLIFSGSVTALGTTAFLVLCAFFFAALRRYRLSVVLTVGSGLLMLGSTIVIQILPLLFKIVGRDDTFTGRTLVWELAANYFWQAPWFGHGYLSLGGKEFLREIAYMVDQPVPGPESGYYEMLLDVGIVGTILFITPFIAVIRNGFEWLKHVNLQDRSAIEFMLMILLSTLVYAITETNSLVCTGFDGIIAFSGFFALLTTPKSPNARLRGEFRLAKYFTKPLYNGSLTGPSRSI